MTHDVIRDELRFAYNQIDPDTALAMVAEWDLSTPEEREAAIADSGAMITAAQVQQLVTLIKAHVISGIFPHVHDYILPHDGQAPWFRLLGNVVIDTRRLQ